MMRRLIEERRKGWLYYYKQLGELTKRQAEITEAMTTSIGAVGDERAKIARQTEE